ncbi:MAG: Fibronectin type III domain protein [Candidatus Jettenia ecosi]|uniref:Fibronectin type III domain protein n=1 Tax=Candidatus Jettenia ecosi TaxID=2494326 RepID=A0A533QG83_9BACT|nr:MAG: Fibronectin type III domain protein [Candidatus Jettenia ecosi]
MIVLFLLDGINLNIYGNSIIKNVQPIANAMVGKLVKVNETVTLNGIGSTDGDGDFLMYTWTLSSIPEGSLSEITNPKAAITTFIPDKAGTYEVTLVVNDGHVNSGPSIIKIKVVTPQEEVILLVKSLQSQIATFNPEVFKFPTMQKEFLNEFDIIIKNIEIGEYKNALNKLENDIFPKIDGCNTSGLPDENDWIINCEVQRSVYESTEELDDKILYIVIPKTITGYVRAFETNRGIYKAKVTIISGPQKGRVVETNDKGIYELTLLPNGKYELKATASARNPDDTTVTITQYSNRYIIKDFSLAKR